MSALVKALCSFRSNNSKINQHLSIIFALENIIRAEKSSIESINPLTF